MIKSTSPLLITTRALALSLFIGSVALTGCVSQKIEDEKLIRELEEELDAEEAEAESTESAE